MWLEVLLLLLLEMTESSRLAWSTNNLGIRYLISISLLVWEKLYTSQSYTLLNNRVTWKLHFSKRFKKYLMLGYHKCMAPSRIQSLVSMTSMTYGHFGLKVEKICFTAVPLSSPFESSWSYLRFWPERWEKAFNGTGDYPVPGEDEC